MSKTDGLLTRKDLIEAMECSSRTVTNWVAKGCPVEVIAGKQYFDVEAVRAWVDAEIQAGNSVGSGDRMQEARLKILDLKAEHERAKIDYFKGKLIDKDEVRQSNLAKVAVIKAGLQKIKGRLYQFEHKTLAQMEATYDSWVDEVLEEWSRA